MSNVHTLPAANANITTVVHAASFNFRNWKKGQEGFNRLNALLESGAITPDMIIVTKDKDGVDANDLYQRKPVNLSIEVPLVTSLDLGDKFTGLQLDYLQALINQTVEKAQQSAVDAGKVADEDLTPWFAVLDQPFKQRTAAVKVTEDMIKAAVTVFATYLEAVGSKEKGIILISNLCAKKFALTACVKVQRKVLEKIQERVVGFVEQLTSDDAENSTSLLHDHTAVINLWATNLEKAVNPEPEEELDADMI